jgi:formylglycine-generating enzyme required for sulfatase activity
MSFAIRMLAIALVITCGSLLTACEDCSTSRDCDTGQVCIEGSCETPEPFDPDDDDDDTGTDVDSDSDSDSDTDTDTDDTNAIEWIQVDGGLFMMGYDDGLENELPVHEVDVPTFEISRSEITVFQYTECYSEGPCTAPEIGARFNWDVSGRGLHPVNGVTWEMATTFCQFVEARLSSEAEWEYAARSGGQDLVYPWGDPLPTCDYCVMNDPDLGMGCEEGHTWPVCLKPDGHTEHGLCDMTGNVYEWLADYYYNTYISAPTDGSAWDEPPYPEYTDRVLRSASYREAADNPIMRTSGRLGFDQSGSEPDLGFRCARDPVGE